MRRAVQNRSFPQALFRVVNKPVASELWGHVGTSYPPSSGLVPPVPPSQRCGLCQNFKQTTLTTRLCKVSTNLYPPLTKNFRRAWNKLSESRLISSAQCKELLYIHFILHMVDFLSHCSSLTAAVIDSLLDLDLRLPYSVMRSCYRMQILFIIFAVDGGILNWLSERMLYVWLHT